MDKGSGQQVHIVENYSRLSGSRHSRLPYLVYGGSRTRYCMRLTLLYIYLVASTPRLINAGRLAVTMVTGNKSVPMAPLSLAQYKARSGDGLIPIFPLCYVQLLLVP